MWKTVYLIEQAGDIHELQDEVNKRLEEGWQLQGGMVTGGTFEFYYQTLYRNEA